MLFARLCTIQDAQRLYSEADGAQPLAGTGNPTVQTDELSKANGEQEDCGNSLHIITSFLLFDGRQNEETLLTLNREGAFSRLVELIRGRQDDDGILHRRLFELLYEMSRIQRLRIEDLCTLDGWVLLQLRKTN